MAGRRTTQIETRRTQTTRAATPPLPAEGEPVAGGCNEVRLRGRVAAEAEERELPSGDRIAQLRVIVPREAGTRSKQRKSTDASPHRRTQTIDTIDLVCWTAATRRAASRLSAGDLVEVTGALRRRFFGGPGGRQSRYEVEVTALRRVARASSAET